MTSQPTLTDIRKTVYMLPVWQLLMGVFIGMFFYLLVGKLAGIAGFFGATISFAGSIVFAFVVFGFGKQTNENMMRKMFRSEAFKILTVAIMFYFAFAKLGLPFLPVIVGFMATLIIFFVALLTVFR